MWHPASQSAAVDRSPATSDLEAVQSSCRLTDRVPPGDLAQVIHELRAPLAPIGAALELLDHPDATVRQHTRDVLRRQVGLLRRLLDDLTDLADGGDGRLRFERQRVDVAAIIEQAVELATPRLYERRHELTLAVEPGLHVEGDPGRLTQVVSNLLINAAKYTPPGGAIQVSAYRAGRELFLSVRDNGIGIGAEVLPHIFERFVRSARARTDVRDGRGLGLYIARLLVHQHGGRIEVHSEGPDRGSEFIVRLPSA